MCTHLIWKHEACGHSTNKGFEKCALWKATNGECVCQDPRGINIRISSSRSRACEICINAIEGASISHVNAATRNHLQDIQAGNARADREDDARNTAAAEALKVGRNSARTDRNSPKSNRKSTNTNQKPSKTGRNSQKQVIWDPVADKFRRDAQDQIVRNEAARLAKIEKEHAASESREELLAEARAGKVVDPGEHRIGTISNLAQRPSLPSPNVQIPSVSSQPTALIIPTRLRPQTTPTKPVPTPSSLPPPPPTQPFLGTGRQKLVSRKRKAGNAEVVGKSTSRRISGGVVVGRIGVRQTKLEVDMDGNVGVEAEVKDDAQRSVQTNSFLLRKPDAWIGMVEVFNLDDD